MTGSPANEAFLAFIALERPIVIDPDAIAEFLRRKAVGSAAAVEYSAAAGPGQPLMFTLNRVPYTVMQIDRPLPRDAYETALRFNRSWPEAGQVLAGCTAHLIVAAVAPIKGVHAMALQQAVDLTRLCAALSEAPQAKAVLWTSADIVIQAARFRLAVDELLQNRIPVMSWIGVIPVLGAKTAKGEQTFGMMTTGLQPFVEREIEFEPSAMQPDEIAKRVLGFAYMLITRGPFIKDGETIGLSAQDFIKVEHLTEGRRPGTSIFLLSPMKSL